MRISLLILAAAACATPFGGQLRFRALDYESAPTVSNAPAVASTPSNATQPNVSAPNTAANDGRQGAAALDALVKRRLPAR